jgi:hypothetical protein
MSSSSSSNIMEDTNEVNELNIVVDLDVEKYSVQKDDDDDDDDDGSMPSSTAGDPKESASTKQEEGAFDELKEEYKEEETVETKSRHSATKRRTTERKGSVRSAAVDSDLTTSTAKGVVGVPPVSARSEYNHDAIYPLSSASSSSSSSSSVRPGAYRVGPHTDDEDEVTRSGIVVQSSVLPDEQQQFHGEELHHVQVIDMEALVDAEASRVLQKEHEEQPVIEAVAQGDEGQFVLSGQENDVNSVCGLPKWCIKWLFLGILMMVLLVVAFYLITRPQPLTPKTMAPSAAPTMALTAKDPIDTIVDLLRDYVPDVVNASSLPKSTEFRAVEWLARNNYTSSVVVQQAYAIVVLYLEMGGDTGIWYNSSLWLSERPICDWYGVGCNDGTNITSVDLSKCEEMLDTVTLVQQHNAAQTDL